MINKNLLSSIWLNALGDANKIENIVFDLKEHTESLEIHEVLENEKQRYNSVWDGGQRRPVPLKIWFADQTGARPHYLLLIPDEIRTQRVSALKLPDRIDKSVFLFLESNEKLKLMF